MITYNCTILQNFSITSLLVSHTWERFLQGSCICVCLSCVAYSGILHYESLVEQIADGHTDGVD